MVGASILRLVVRRLLQAIPVMLLIIAGSFFALHLAPGDMVDVLISAGGGAPSPEMIDELRRYYGLDQPIYVQILYYFRNILSFNLGYSFAYDQPVVEVLKDRLPATMILMVASVMLASILGGVLGMIAAAKRGTAADETIRVIGLLFYATPNFWLSLMLILVFGLKTGWFPINGFETIGSPYTGWRRVADIAHHMVLPAAGLSLIFSAIYMQIMRASILETASLDYALTARSKGLSRRQVLRRHVLPNAILPVITMIGLQVGTVLGGAVVVESVFAIPGIGSLAFQSVVQRDLNMLMGVLIVCSVIVILANLLVDIAYQFVDPRIQGD